MHIRDNSSRAQTLRSVFFIFIAVSVISMLSSYADLSLLQRIEAGEAMDASEAENNEFRQMLVGLVQMAIYITSVMVFLNWFRRSYGNLQRLDVRLEHKEPMAVWAWFIPIISLFRPVQMMGELWNKTQIEIKSRDASYEIKEQGWAIGAWWTLFVIGNIVGNYLFKKTLRDESVADMISTVQAELIVDALQIVEAVMVIVIVDAIAKMEDKLAEEVEREGGLIRP